AVPLSYAYGIFVRDRGPVNWQSIEPYTSSATEIYEVQARGVKLIAKNHAEASARLLLAGAGGVGLQRPDALGERPAAFGVAAAGSRATRCGAIGRSRRFRQRRRFCCQHGLDRRIRSLELHREFGDFGGDIVDALAQLLVFIVALGKQFGLGAKAGFQVVDAVAEHFGFLDLEDQLAIEIGDALD